MVVVFLFLRNWRATLIAAVALPLSIIPTFFVMQMLGFTLNGISLLAITLVTGILVDDAIVEIENIVRHINMGTPAYDASMEAANEIGLTVSDGELTSTTSYLLSVKAKAESKDEGTSGSYAAWSANSKYKAGDIVNNHGKLFQCKPFPYSGWCNNAPAYYEPGAGLAWSDAWTAL